MEPVSVAEMQALDQWAIQKIGIPQAVLMENAGRSVFDFIVQEVRPLNSAIVVAYKGNNGGDGLVVARYLNNAGIKIKVYLLCAKGSMTDAAASNLMILEKLGVEVIEVIFGEELKLLQKEIGLADVVVDAIFGIGLKGEPKEVPAQAIKIINSAKKATIVSVDIPSGMHGDTGEGKQIVSADITVTFHAPKVGMLESKALAKVGKLFVSDIGIPPKGIKAKKIYCLEQELIAGLIPKRRAGSHKGDFGRVLVIAGSAKMPGAAALVAKGALRTGAGLVKTVTPFGIRDLVFSLGPEVMVVPAAETTEGSLAFSALEEIKKMLSWATVVAIGPGLSQNKETARLVFSLLTLISNKHKKIKLVVDADAINIISNKPSILLRLRDRTVITPHPGEMSKLSHIDAKAVQLGRVKVAQNLAIKYGICVVLKGANTVIAEKKRSVAVNLSGNSGMATAGSGDVLTGIISAFLAQGMDPYAAALAGVYCHGLAGDLIVQLKGKRGMVASDIVEAIPYVLRFIRS